MPNNANLGRKDATIKKLQRELATIKAVVEAQANDEGLWFQAETVAEDYVQMALRQLHEAIEGKSSEQCAVEVLLGLR